MGYQPTHSNIKITTPPNPYVGADRIVTVGRDEFTCPNCGAPIKGKVCNYCRTGFRRDTDRSDSAVVISQAISNVDKDKHKEKNNYRSCYRTVLE